MFVCGTSGSLLKLGCAFPQSAYIKRYVSLVSNTSYSNFGGRILMFDVSCIEDNVMK